MFLGSSPRGEKKPFLPSASQEDNEYSNFALCESANLKPKSHFDFPIGRIE